MSVRRRTLTPKQEKFCHGIVAGLSKTEAYRGAYKCKGMKATSVHANSGKLMANTTIRLRIEALRPQVIKKLEFGIEQAMREADSLMHQAVMVGQVGAGVAALQLKARLKGLLVEKHEYRHRRLEEAPTPVVEAVIAVAKERLRLVGPKDEHANGPVG